MDEYRKNPEEAASAVPDTLMEALRELSLRAATDLTRFTQQLRELHDRFDGTPLSGGGSGMSEHPRPRLGELAYEAIKLQLQLASQLLTIGHKQADFWLDRAARMGNAMTPRNERPPLRVRSEDGTWRVYIYNAARERRTLRLSAGEWRRDDGEKVGPSCVVRFKNDEDASIGGQAQKHVGLIADREQVPRQAGTYALLVDVLLAGESVTTPLGRLELILHVETSDG